MAPKVKPISRRRPQSPMPESSSDGNPSGIDFRCRLQSVAPSESRATASAPNFLGAPQKVVEQFQADFTFEPTPPPTTAQRSASNRSDKTQEVVLRLTNAFTQTGSAMHAAAVERLVRVHAEIEHQISQFVKLSSNAIASNDALYRNIAYPLSQTLCSDETHPRATVATHLAGLAEDLGVAEDKLKDLERDWDACLDAENKAWTQLSNRSRPQSHVEDLSDAFDTGESAEFRKEAQNIFRTKAQMIEDIEEEYKEQIRTETTKILRHVME